MPDIIGINPEVADDLNVGVLSANAFKQRWWPESRPYGLKTLYIIPTSFALGLQPIDLLGTDGRKIWLRTGEATHIGDDQGVVYSRVSHWLKAMADGKSGCCWLGEL